MTETKLCGCPCGTQLTPRKDGSFGNYIPGHDAKHKSILVNQALEGSEEAIKVLEAKNWIRYFHKAKASREKRSNRDKQKNMVGNRKIKTKTVSPTPANRLDAYGLTDLDLLLVEFPPTATTWICRSEHGGEGPIFVNGGLAHCWFCHEPATDEHVWPQFEEALQKFLAIDWTQVEDRARVGDYSKEAQGSEEVQFNRKLMRLKRKHDKPETEDPDTEPIHEAPSVGALDYDAELADVT